MEKWTWIIPIFIALFQFVQWYTTRRYSVDKDNKEEILNRVASVEEDFKERVEELKTFNHETEKRVRSLEAKQITEEKVKDLLGDRIKPLEENLKQFEIEMKTIYKEQSSEWKEVNRFMMESMNNLAQDVNIIKGQLSARRMEDASKQ